MKAGKIRLPVAEVLPQMMRFALAGLAVTALSAVVYLGLSTASRVPPLLANIAGHLCGVIVGFQLHSRWSFRQDARHDGLTRLVRFAAGSGASFLLNSFWVWSLVNGLGSPAWAPIPAMLFVTPLASFAINRWWVFAQLVAPRRENPSLTPVQMNQERPAVRAGARITVITCATNVDR